jgi:hemoglobin-like flavoprotein
MTPAQIADVRASFAAIRPIADTAAWLFYGRLFELDASLRPMFKRDMDEQGRLLMQVIGVAIASLDRIETLMPTLREMGRKHAGYGVQARHYDTVGAALLWTLERGLGEAFTPPMRESWTTVYGLLAQVMQDGAAMPKAA